MRLHRLDVENFRGVRRASIAFAPGVNVLYGPNDLGKSTLAEAIRAALLVPVRTKEGRSYVTWGSSEPASVVLTFECGGKVWRVRKSFGSGFKSVLEQADRPDGTFRAAAQGNAVEGQLRELLCWGVPPPGGKGAPAKPASYLVTALLGRQGAVQEILDATLADDKDATGRTLITKALGALGQDPLVAGIIARLSDRVNAVFTPGGKFKTGAESPLVVLQRKLQEQEERLRALREADQSGRQIEQEVVEFQREQVQLLEQKLAAETSVAQAEAEAARGRRRADLETQAAALREEIDRAESLEAEMQSLRQRLAAAVAERDRLRDEAKTAEAALEGTKKRMQGASEEIVRAGGALTQAKDLREAARRQARAELEIHRGAAEARLKAVESAEQARSAVSAAEAELEVALAAERAAAAAAAEAELVVERATVQGELGELLERDAAAGIARSAFEAAQQREAEAARQLATAEDALARARGQLAGPHVSEGITAAEAELADLRVAAIQLEIRALSAAVLELEGADERARRHRAAGSELRERASALEREAANRTLPTREQIDSWRALEREMAADAASPPPPPPSRLIPIAAGIGGGLVASVLAFTFGQTPMVAMALGVATAIVLALITGNLWRGTARDSVAAERRTRLAERWAAEVVPALRAAGLAGLSAYEEAVAEIRQRRLEAEQLRLDADREDVRASAESVAAAPLEGKRAELDRLRRDAPPVRRSVTSLLERFETIDALRAHGATVERQREELRSSALRDAEDAVRSADGVVSELRRAHQDLLSEAAAAKAAAEIALQQCEPSRRNELQGRLRQLSDRGTAAASLEAAATGAQRRKEEASDAATRVANVRGQRDTLNQRASELLEALGEDLAQARVLVDAEFTAIAERARALDAADTETSLSEAEALAAANGKYAALEQRSQQEREALDAALAAAAASDEALTELRTQVAQKEGELKNLDPAAAKAKLSEALSDPVFQSPAADVADLAHARSMLEKAQRKLEECDRRLHGARGQLHLVVGHAGAERLAQQQELVSYIRDEVIEREQAERGAYRLLAELRSVEAERASHLGRALGGPISEAFRELTGGRYGQLALDAELKTRDIGALGEPREVGELSVGTREQLATLIRLVVAAQLRTAVLLDDQLVHSDSGRLHWFRDRIQASAREHDHQVIVLTCRPGDYLPNGPSSDGVAVVDLGAELG